MDVDPAAAKSGTQSWMERYSGIILVVAALACLLPFAGKAFHMDDPLFVWAGRHLQTNWPDPYGFDVNWYGWTMPMHEVTKNPPLASVWIALVASISDGSEFWLHLGFLVQAIAAVLGTYVLARRFCANPFHAALATLVTPVFLVSSTTLMCDVLMVALWVWAIVFWMRGLEKNEPLVLALAGVLIGAATLAKYFGIALIPLLLAYSLVKRGKIEWRWWPYLLLPVAMVGSYDWVTRVLYGHGLFLEAFTYAKENETRTIVGFLFKAVTAIGFAGGGCAIVLIFAPIIWRARIWAWAGMGLIVLLPMTWILLGAIPNYAASPLRPSVALQWSVFILAGLGVLALPILDWRRQRNGESLLLLLWVLGTFVFCVLNWTINGRSILPMVPAIAILLLRRVETLERTTGANLCLGAAAALSLLVCLADYHLAECARAAANQIKQSAPTARIWFQGHWGFQYYAQEEGLRAFDSKRADVRSGDLIVLPFNNTNLTSIPTETAEHVGTVEVPMTSWLSTVNRSLGAGLYSDKTGPLPFAFGAVPAEKYYILRFK